MNLIREFGKVPYRHVLAKTTEEDILWQTNRYLTGRAEVSTPFLLGDGDSLLVAFRYWFGSIGQDSNKAIKAYQKIFTDIRQNQIVSVVLADTFRKDVWEGRPNDGNRYAYFICSGTGDKFRLETMWDGPTNMDIEPSTEAAMEERTWSDIEARKRKEAPAPDKLRPMLSNKAVRLYDQCLERLKYLGWNGAYLQNPKSFVVTLPTRFDLPIRISLGLPDYDAKSHTLESRLAGGAGFRFDINLKALFTSDELQNEVLYIARRLITEANYRARGAGQKLGIRDLSAKEMDKWHGELHHWTIADERDFIGRTIDERDIKVVFGILADLIQTNDLAPAYIEKRDMKKLFSAINIAMIKANLRIVYAGAQETVEIRLPDPEYRFAFGSIQYCHPQRGDYLELRFKRIHLKHVGLLDKLDSLRENPYRNDVASSNPEAVRFQFRHYSEETVSFIENIADIIRQSINSN